MTEDMPVAARPAAPVGVELLEPAGIRLVETPAPSLPASERAALDRVWAQAVRADPGLFDGPAVACTGLTPDGPDILVLHWAPVGYRLFALRLVPGATTRVSSLYVAVVQPADDGRILVGRSPDSATRPGRWCLPGGCAEPPPPGDPLDPCALRRHAARELNEETGVFTSPDELTRWLLVRGDHGNVGVLHLAPSRPAVELTARHAELYAAHRSLGTEPELDRIALVGSPAEAAALPGPQADHLAPVLRRLLGG
ncbi:NUDIX domain-containing protein [Kitasatospora xanthocidica]|uniref:NUDIX domain-containing protein n=1 Tax=Kitasatospora xanthocidica TaxID=83382 RepID=UPI001E2B2CBF|nr:NUDIX domain-containing protein [Kitasatospora xanthocidica]